MKSNHTDAELAAFMQKAVENLREPLVVSRIVFSEVERLINAGELEAAKQTLREFQRAIDAALASNRETAE